MRHEVHRVAGVHRRFALVYVPGQCVRHEVVTQLVGFVAVRRCGAGTGIAGHAETVREAFEQSRIGAIASCTAVA